VISRLMATSAMVSIFVLGVSTLFAAPSSAASSGRHALDGTFKLQAGACFGDAVTGTYFRMIFPNGSVSKGKFFDNPDSTCPNKTFTLAVPGQQGGLITGIVQPQSFTAIDFSIATNKKDPQTGLTVPPPAISDDHGKLSGQVEAWSAAWNKLYFNQGSPKPTGKRPGLTEPLSGTYNAKTRAFVITWASQVVGGPFNGFTGYWHLAGTFEAAQ